MVTVLIPIEDGHSFTTEVLQGMAIQGSNYQFRIVSRQPYLENREQNINLTREALKWFVDSRSEFTILMDSDVILTEGILNKMVETIEQNPTTAFAVDTKGGYITGDTADHIITALAIVPTWVVRAINYMDNSTECACQKIRRLIEVKYILNTSTKETKCK